MTCAATGLRPHDGQRDLLPREWREAHESPLSQLRRAGGSPKVISERLGHSKVGFTLDIYGHILPGMEEEAAQKVDSGLRAALQKQRRPMV